MKKDRKLVKNDQNWWKFVGNDFKLVDLGGTSGEK